MLPAARLPSALLALQVLAAYASKEDVIPAACGKITKTGNGSVAIDSTLCCQPWLNDAMLTILSQPNVENTKERRMALELTHALSPIYSNGFTLKSIVSRSEFAIADSLISSNDFCKIQHGQHHIIVYAVPAWDAPVVYEEAKKVVDEEDTEDSPEMRCNNDALRERLQHHAEVLLNTDEETSTSKVVQMLSQLLSESFSVPLQVTVSKGERVYFSPGAPLYCEVHVRGHFFTARSGKEASPAKSSSPLRRRRRDLPGRLGSLAGCGNEQLRQTMETLLRPLFTVFQLPLGDIAGRLQKAVQTVTGNSFEVVISKADFVLASDQKAQDKACRARIGDYITLVYQTPVLYDINSAEEKILSNIDFGEPLGGSGYPGQQAFPKFAELFGEAASAGASSAYNAFSQGASLASSALSSASGFIGEAASAGASGAYNAFSRGSSLASSALSSASGFFG